MRLPNPIKMWKMRNRREHLLVRLKASLRKHLPTCPICAKKMSFGYLSGPGDLYWLKRKRTHAIAIRLSAETRLVGLGAIPSYLCTSCQLVIGQYRDTTLYPSTRITGINENGRRPECCPYCNYLLTKGHILFGPNLGYYLPITWSAERRVRFWNKKKVYFTKLASRLLWVENIPVKRCKPCGIIFLKFNSDVKD